MPLTHRPIQIECFLWRTIAETVILITTVNIFFFGLLTTVDDELEVISP